MVYFCDATQMFAQFDESIPLDDPFANLCFFTYHGAVSRRTLFRKRGTMPVSDSLARLHGSIVYTSKSGRVEFYTREVCPFNESDDTRPSIHFDFIQF